MDGGSGFGVMFVIMVCLQFMLRQPCTCSASVRAFASAASSGQRNVPRCWPKAVAENRPAALMLTPAKPGPRLLDSRITVS